MPHRPHPAPVEDRSSRTRGALDSWPAERRRLGQDGRDEVWNGVYHVVPHAHSSHGALAHRLSLALAGHANAAGLTTLGGFDLGSDEHDFRVPVVGWTSTPIEDLTLYLLTVEVVVEFESPGDETWEEVPFSFARGAGEVWVITPHHRSVTLLTAPGRTTGHSALLHVTVDGIAQALGWA